LSFTEIQPFVPSAYTNVAAAPFTDITPFTENPAIGSEFLLIVILFVAALKP